MEQVIVAAAVQAAMELTNNTIKQAGENKGMRIDEHFAIHYAAIIKAINENPIQEAPESSASR